MKLLFIHLKMNFHQKWKVHVGGSLIFMNIYSKISSNEHKDVFETSPSKNHFSLQGSILNKSKNLPMFHKKKITFLKIVQSMKMGINHLFLWINQAVP